MLRVRSVRAAIAEAKDHLDVSIDVVGLHVLVRNGVSNSEDA